MDANEHLRLSNITQIKVKEWHFYYCSTFHSHSRVFNNEHNSYSTMSMKQFLVEQ